jgi:cytidylate kinase
MSADYDEVLKEIRARDERDSGRSSCPLRQAEDAVLLDTSDLTAEEAVARAADLVEQRRGE